MIGVWIERGAQGDTGRGVDLATKECARVVETHT
jgi:hypothetical protein